MALENALSGADGATTSIMLFDPASYPLPEAVGQNMGETASRTGWKHLYLQFRLQD